MCNLKVLNPDNNTELVGVQGEHLQGKENFDVQLLKGVNQDLPKFPKGVGNFFPKLKAIRLLQSSLRELSANDLKPFSDLIYIRIYNNPLSVVDGDSFKFNKKLKLVDLDSNKIEHVGPNLLSHSKDLKEVKFENNICIDVNARTDEAIEALNQQLPIKCPPVIRKTTEESVASSDDCREQVTKRVLALESEKEEISERLQMLYKASEKNVTQLRSEVERLEGKLDNQTSINAKLYSEVEDMKKNLKALSEAVTKPQKDIAAAERKLLDAKLKHLTKRAADENAKLKKAFTRSLNVLKESQISTAKIVTSVADQFLNLKESMEEKLFNVNEEVEAAADRLKKNLAEQSNFVVSNSKTLEKLIIEVTTMKSLEQNHFETLTEQVEELNQTLKHSSRLHLKQNIDSQDEQLSKCCGISENTTLKVEEIENEFQKRIESLEENFEGTKSEFSSATEEMNQKLNNQSEEMVVFRNKSAAVATRINLIQERLKKLKPRFESIAYMHGNLSSRLTLITQKLFDFKTFIEESSASVDSKILILADSLVNVSRISDSTAAGIQPLTDQIEELSTEVERLKEKVDAGVNSELSDAIGTSNSLLEERINALEVKVGNLTASGSKLSTGLRKLKRKVALRRKIFKKHVKSCKAEVKALSSNFNSRIEALESNSGVAVENVGIQSDAGEQSDAGVQSDAVEGDGSRQSTEMQSRTLQNNLEERIESLEHKVEDLTALVGNQSFAIAKYQESPSSSKMPVTTLSENFAQRIESINDRLRKLAQLNESLSHEIEQLRQEIAKETSLTLKLDENNLKASDITIKRIAELKSELNQLAAEISTDTKNLKLEVAKQDQTIAKYKESTLTKTLKVANDMKKSFEERLNAEEKVSERLNKLTTSLSKDVDKLKEKLEDELKRITKIDEKSSEASRVTDSNDKYRARVGSMENKMNVLQSRINELNEETTKLRNAVRHQGKG